MAGVRISDKDKGWAALKQILESLRQGDSYVKIGLLGEKAAESHPSEAGDDKVAQPMTNVQLGIIHEFGAGHVPERSFIRSSFDAHKQEYIATMRAMMPDLYAGKVSVYQVLDRVGYQAKWDMKNAILRGAGISPPLAPATVAAKHSSRPLVDSGRLVAAIDHAVMIRNQPAGAQGTQVGSATILSGPGEG